MLIDLICLDKSMKDLLFSYCKDKFKMSKIKFLVIPPCILVLNKMLFRNIIDLSVWCEAVHVFIDYVIDINYLFITFNNVLCCSIVFDKVFEDIVHMSFEFYCNFDF
jgi:hypothetical protein